MAYPYVAFWYYATPFRLVRRGPGERVHNCTIRVLTEGDHGLVRVGTDVQPADELTADEVLFSRSGPARVVGDVDWDSRARDKLGVITWAGPARVRQRQQEAATELNLQFHGIRLLDWLADRAGGTQPGFEDVTLFVRDQGLPTDSAQLLVEHLAGRGVIEPLRASGGRTEAMITALGIDAVQQVRAERTDVVRRTRELGQRMLTWLLQQEYLDTQPPDWAGFAASEHGRFHGDLFTLGEVERRAGYLSERGLITGLSIDQAAPGTLNPGLTAAGRDCVIDFGANVADYLNRAPNGPTNHITMNHSTGQVVVGSENVRQTIRTGLDTRKLREFAEYVRQVAPTLGMTEDQVAAVQADATELCEATEATEPDHGRLRQLCDAVMRAITQAAPTVVQTAAIALGNDAIHALTGH